VLRRRILAAAAVVAVVLLAVLVWPVGVLTGGDDENGGGGNGQAASGDDGAPIDTNRVGSALIAEQGGKTRIIVTAQGLEPSSESKAYQVWLYDSASKRKSLGATATDQQGNLQVVGDLPADYQDWQFIDVTSVTVTGQGNDQRLKNGPSVLRGALELAPEPIQTGTGKNKATVLATIALRPLPD
jgi:hypothetical protein